VREARTRGTRSPSRFASHAIGRKHVLRLSYAISAILPQNVRSRRVAQRLGVRAAGQMEVWGLTWDRYVWPLATGGAAQFQPASTK